jgi:hypothetical protein
MAEEYDPAVYDAEDDAPPALQAVKYRAFRAELSAVLLRFEKASDWADYASQLGEIRRCLNRHAQHAFIPEKYALSKWLAHCLYGGFPAGLHLKALEVYELIFQRIGARRLARDLSIYAVGLFPLMSYCSTAVRPKLLDIYRRYIVVLRAEHLLPASQPQSTLVSAAPWQGTSPDASMSDVAPGWTVPNDRTRSRSDTQQPRAAASVLPGPGASPSRHAAVSEDAKLLDSTLDVPTGEHPLPSLSSAAAVREASNFEGASQSLPSAEGTLVELEPKRTTSWIAVDQQPTAGHATFDPARLDTSAGNWSPLRPVIAGLVQGLLPALDEVPAASSTDLSDVQASDLLAQVRQNLSDDAFFAEALWRAMLCMDFNGWMVSEWMPAALASATPTDRSLAMRTASPRGPRAVRARPKVRSARWIAPKREGVSTANLISFRALQQADLDQTHHAESSLASRLRLVTMQYLLKLDDEARAPSTPDGVTPVSRAALFGNTGLVTAALERALMDGSALVVRQALDLMLQTIVFVPMEHQPVEKLQPVRLEHIPLLRVRETAILFTEVESKTLLAQALLVVLREDASLRKRLYAWMEDQPAEHLFQAVVEEILQDIGAWGIEQSVFTCTKAVSLATPAVTAATGACPRAPKKAASDALADGASETASLVSAAAFTQDPLWIADAALTLAQVLRKLAQRQCLREHLERILVSTTWRLGRLVLLQQQQQQSSSSSTLPLTQAPEAFAPIEMDPSIQRLLREPHHGCLPPGGAPRSELRPAEAPGVTAALPALAKMWSAVEHSLREALQLLGPDQVWGMLHHQLHQMESQLEPPRSLRVLFECLLFVVAYAGLPSLSMLGQVLDTCRYAVILCARLQGPCCPETQLPALEWRHHFTVLARVVSAIRIALRDSDPATKLSIFTQALRLLETVEKRIWRPWLERNRLTHGDLPEGAASFRLERLRSYRFACEPWLVEDARAGCDLIAELVQLALSICAFAEGEDACSDVSAGVSAAPNGARATSSSEMTVNDTADTVVLLQTRVASALEDAVQLAVCRTLPLMLLGLDHYLDLLDSASQQCTASVDLLASVPIEKFRDLLIPQCWLFLHPSLLPYGRQAALLWYSLQEFYPTECQAYIAAALKGEWGSPVEHLAIFRQAFCLARELRLAQSLSSNCLFLALDALRSENSASRIEAERFVRSAVRLAPELVLGPLLGLLLCESYPILNDHQEFITRPDIDRIVYALETLRLVLAVLEQHARNELVAGFRGIGTDAQSVFRALSAPVSTAIATALTAVHGPEEAAFTQDYLDACVFAALWYLRARWSSHWVQRMQTYAEESGPFCFSMRNLQASIADAQTAAVQLLEQLVQFAGMHGDVERLQRIAPTVVALLELLLGASRERSSSSGSIATSKTLSVLCARVLRQMMRFACVDASSETAHLETLSSALGTADTSPALTKATATGPNVHQRETGSSLEPAVAGATSPDDATSGASKHRKSKRHGRRFWPKYASWSRMGAFLTQTHHAA